MALRSAFRVVLICLVCERRHSNPLYMSMKLRLSADLRFRGCHCGLLVDGTLNSIPWERSNGLNSTSTAQ